MALVGAAAGAKADTYWAYTYQSFDVLAAGSSAFAESIARNLERFDIAFAEIAKLDLGQWRPPTHIYALDPGVLKLVWPNPTAIESTYHTGEFATDIVMDNQGEQDNRYHGAYFGYAGSLLTTEGRLRFPYWFQMGMSDLFAASIVRSNEVTIGGYSQGQVRSLKEKPWIPMRTLLRLSGADPQLRNSDAQFHLQYESECWLLLHMVMIEGARRDQLTAYLAALGNGTPEEQAFAQGIQGSYEDLDKELQAFLYKGLLRTLTVKVPADTDRITPLKLTAAQANARLAELTIRTQRDIDYGLKLAAQSLTAEQDNEYALRAEARGWLDKGQFAESYKAVQALSAVATLSATGRTEAASVYGALARAVEGHRADLGVEATILFSRATDAYGQALAADSENLPALYGYAEVLLAQGDRERIRAFLLQAEKAVYHHPHSPGLARSVSTMCAMLGDTDNALTFAFAWKRAALTAAERNAADAYMARLRTSKAQQEALAPTPPAQ
jgi:hypothetical protein